METNPGITGLISWWKLDEESGTRYDSHGTNHLTDANTVLYAAGKKGNAADFELSAAEHLYVADNTGLSMGAGARMTCGAWIKGESFGGDERSIISKRAALDLEYYLRLQNSATPQLNFEVSSNGEAGGIKTVLASTFGNLSTATWYFCVGRYDGTNLSVSVNGTWNSTAFTADIHDDNNPLTIGARTSGGGATEYFDGLIDEAFLYKRALSDDDVDWLYNSGNGRTYSEVLGPPKVKTWNGIAIGSVKTINGIAIANVKSVQGLT